MKVLTILLLAHFLGDFYLQFDKLAKWKERSFAGVLTHSLIYAGTMFLTLVLLGGGHLLAVSVCAASHFAVDTVKFFVSRAVKKRGDTGSAEKIVFCADQLLHLAVVFAAALLVTARFPAAVPPYMNGLSALIHADAYHVINYLAMFLAVMKPANVFVRVMLGGGASGADEGGGAAENTGFTAGRFIGGLERILVIIFLALGQYGSIALVFTAKSIARFKQLDDRRFAEYYIFGTLLSAVTAAFVFFILKRFGA